MVNQAAGRAVRHLYNMSYRLKNALFPNVSLQQNPVLRNVLSKLLTSTRPASIKDIHGHVIFLDEMDSLNLSLTGEHEPAEGQLLQQLVGSGQSVIDVGANIGYFTLLLAKLVGPRGHVFAFEPDPTNFALLKKNIAANAYTNITAEQCAVSNSKEPLHLFLCETNRGDHRVYDSGGSRHTIDVPSVRLDQYFANTSHDLRVIKMDIQGAEWGALQGMSSLLERNPQISLLTEFWPRGLDLAGADPERFFEHLVQLGFKAFELGAKGVAPAPTSYSQLAKSYTVANNHFTVLLFRRH